MVEKENQAGKNKLNFIREVAKYFMDFLETDFHKRRVPKRSILINNPSNLLVGINLNKYPEFKNLIWGRILKIFSSPIRLKKRQYKANIPTNLLDLVKLSIKRISKKQISSITDQVKGILDDNSTLYKKEFTKGLTIVIDSVNQVFKKELVIPLISKIEKPLEDSKLGDENTAFLMEEELTDILEKIIDEEVVNSFKQLVSNEKVDVGSLFQKSLTLKEAKNQIDNYFNNLRVFDLYSEIYELDRNKSILDKQEFYFYFGDISFNKAKYPIFYIPLLLEKEGDGFVINFDAQVYINKKALEFIAQEYNKEKDKHSRLKTITERIIYLAQEKDNFINKVMSVFSELEDFFDLDQKIDINNSNSQTSKCLLAKISNSCYISLFDKSDEALVNDYELILESLEDENNPLSSVFNKIIDDFIYKDPKTYIEDVENEWQDLDSTDKLVYKSPIPLNSEQRQILKAIQKQDCNYVTVEGPPGTGKSHTITAIAFEYILNNKSVLILSDKKEALDVVEDKINQTIKKVRFDESFQNPLLRLGKIGNTYSQILSTNTISNIRNYYRAINSSHRSLEENIVKTINSIKENLKAESLSYSTIDINEIKELELLELTYSNNQEIDIDELLSNQDSALALQEFRVLVHRLDNFFSEENNAFRYFKGLIENKNISLNRLRKTLDTMYFIIENSVQVKNSFPETEKLFNLFLSIKDNYPESIEKFINKYKSIKSRLFGYLFKKGQLETLNQEFKKKFPVFKLEKPHEHLKNFEKLLEIFNYAISLCGSEREIIKHIKDLSKGNCPHCDERLVFSDEDRENRKTECPECNKEFSIEESQNQELEEYKVLETQKIDIDKDYLKKIDYLHLLYKLLTTKAENEIFQSIENLKNDISFLLDYLDKYPKTINRQKIDISSLTSLFNCSIAQTSEEYFNSLLRYLVLKQKITDDFNRIPEVNFFQEKNDLERLVTVQMTNLMDKRVIDFYQNNLATARTLREIIKDKRQFPKEEFKKLKQAFPCILAGIRDYAEYIPLSPEIFDLVIIDEASQVSIAQAFPALLRAKKVLILGDKKQFSNVKSSQARTDTNRNYLNQLQRCFLKNVSDTQSHLKRLEKFNIKTSILEFFEFINNFNIQLKKHFRGYKEIISYSDHHFYQDSLEVMKIRGIPIDQVIKFIEVKSDGKEELIQNTNSNEIDEILKQLKLLLESKEKVSVGIITPHTNQQKLFVEKINQLDERDKLYKDLNLKIMTFDTCQGEERDVIFYSMVATENMDRLWGVFIKDLGKIDLEENGQIKAQRLNVGFSRAKEQINIVHSKPLEKFEGAIGNALRHYKFTLENAKKEPLVDKVDRRSPMEKQLLHWLLQTKLYKENKETIEVRPQFPLGEYLRQLDRSYQHPNYVVDFLITFLDKKGQFQKIIVEYDGFEFHFREKESVNEITYSHYYNDDDLYRQKVLEGYGYKFIRINKFNLGENPLDSLNKKIDLLFKENDFSSTQAFLRDINTTITGLQNGEMKECPNCKQIKNNSEFRDSSLITGYGRICLQCKNGTANNQPNLFTENKHINCPKCGSHMILRSGRYGKFYGCSRFPYCHGTRRY